MLFREDPTGSRYCAGQQPEGHSRSPRTTMSRSDRIDATILADLRQLEESDAKRLCSILQGLFVCLKDLDNRLAVLENASGEQSKPDADTHA